MISNFTKCNKKNAFMGVIFYCTLITGACSNGTSRMAQRRGISSQLVVITFCAIFFKIYKTTNYKF